MSATTVVARAKLFTQVAVILISVGLVPVLVGTIGRSLTSNSAFSAFDPQMDVRVFQP